MLQNPYGNFLVAVSWNMIGLLFFFPLGKKTCHFIVGKLLQATHKIVLLRKDTCWISDLWFGKIYFLHPSLISRPVILDSLQNDSYASVPVFSYKYILSAQYRYKMVWVTGCGLAPLSLPEWTLPLYCFTVVV